MSDLIERLRWQANCESPPVDDLLREAADALEAARADAERYRWLRKDGRKQDEVVGSGVVDIELDASIDAAMAAEGRE